MQNARTKLTDAEVVEMASMTMRHIKRLATAGHFPHAVNGEWDAVKVGAGLISYYRDSAKRATGTLNDEKLHKMAAERKLAELELKRQLREVLPARDVDRAWTHLLVAARTRWLQLPTRAVPAFALWANARDCEAWLDAEARSILNDMSASPDYRPRVEDDDEDDEPEPKPVADEEDANTQAD